MTFRTSAALLLTACSIAAGAYDVKTPELVPVRFESAQNHAVLKLVENGKPLFAIVTDKAAEKNRRWREEKSIEPAVELLVEAFEKCTGSKPAVLDVSENAEIAKYPVRILVGDSAETRKLGIDVSKMPNQGFAVRTAENVLVIVGRDSSLMPDYNRKPLEHLGPERGTLWGAYDFVERFLGCRFWYPGELGSIWPKTENLEIAPVSYTDSPRFITRDPCWVYWTMSDLRSTWEPMLGAYRKGTIYPDAVPFFERWRLARVAPFWAGHNPRPEKFREAYPDQKELIFYRAPNGNQYYNEKQHVGNYFNVVDLKFADLLVESLKKFYASEGRANDGWNELSENLIPFGQCDSDVTLPDMIHHPTVRAEKLITPENIARGDEYSDIYGRFYQYLGNRLKKELPGKKLVILPYSKYTQAPLNPKWTLPDNIEMRVCFYGMDRIRAPETAEKWKKLVHEWFVAQGNRPVASLWLYNVPGFELARAIAPEMVGDVVKLLGSDLGNNDLFLDQYGPLEWWYYYSNYAAVRSMWNPDFNVDAAIDAHWDAMYGPKAAPFLREFHRVLKDAYLKVYVPARDRNILYPAPTIDKLESLLKQAEAVLEPGTVERKRFDIFARPWPKAFESQRNRMSYARPVTGVHRLLSSEKITVDGDGSDAVWSQCPVLPMRDPRGTNEKPAYPADVRLAWSEDGLYGRAVMPYDPKADPARSVWDNSSLEFLVSPGMKGESYYHYAVDPVGNIHFGTKELLPVEKAYNEHWKSPGFRSSVKTSKDSWTVEFFLPWSDLSVEAPRVYESWRMNMVHNKKTPPAEYSGNSMSLGNNHNLPMFGLIKFLGKGE